MRKLTIFLILIAFFIAGCMSEPDFTIKEEKRNVSAPAGTKYEFYNCSAPFQCWENYGKKYSCFNYPDPEGDFTGTGACARRLDKPCGYDSDCSATEKCWGKTFNGKGLCIRITSLELPPGTPLEANKSQDEPPIMLPCETNNDCPNWQYNQYRCKEIFKYGKVCVANRAGAISGKTPGCTNDINRDLLNGACLPEDGEFCINNQPYITHCETTDWCVDNQYCIRKK